MVTSSSCRGLSQSPWCRVRKLQELKRPSQVCCYSYLPPTAHCLAPTTCRPPSLPVIHPHHVPVIHPHHLSSTLTTCHPPSLPVIYPHHLSSTLTACHPPSLPVIHPHHLSSTLTTCHLPYTLIIILSQLLIYHHNWRTTSVHKLPPLPILVAL